jgi:threonine aldolase
MRQVGVLAATGLVALRDGSAGMIDRLAEDHENARRLAESIAELDGVISPGDIAQPAPGRLDPARVATNFVVFKVDRDRDAFIDSLARRGVLLVAYPHGQVRAVTHYGVEPRDIETVIDAFREALAETSPSTDPAAGTLAGAAA